MEPSSIVAPTRQADQDGGPMLEHAGALGPLDQGDGIGRRLVETSVDPGHAVEAIKIVVLDRQPPSVLVMQNKGRAVHNGGDA